MTLATLIALAAEETEHSGNVALETVGFGILALGIFIFLALVTFSYRNVANRHAHKAERYAQVHADDLRPPGHGH
jgi:hypothetical protein